MYQLSHLLIEQRNILATLRDENGTNDAKGMVAETEEDGEHDGDLVSRAKIIFFFIAEAADRDELQNKKAIIAIKENLIGFNDSLENKVFLHEGALIELDSDSYRPICRVYFFLFNDLLIIGKVKHDK